MIAITPGEPAGIGPDLVVQAAQRERQMPWLVIADKNMLAARAQLLQLPLTLDDNLQSPSLLPGHLTVLHTPLANTVIPGLLDTANVPGVMAALDAAIAGCMRGDYSALLTGPIQKSVVNDAGIAFSGHTEYLAEKSGVEDVVMLLMTDAMRVALATTHLPLAQVSNALTQPLLERRLHILNNTLRQQFAVAQPRILVAGLNPHAGEGGHLGSEEINVIQPVCEHLRSQGMDLVGPLPADTLFTPKYLQHADAVMSMFHDQGLPVLKYSGFGQAVNVTLGLPFIRTSVDHGTALDIAGSGDADLGSFLAALTVAYELITNKELNAPS
ncbi:MAG: 4-hydroxythreonine-4-phosphate dehydrogenase PdxA [Gammaproteobacteria bacterium]|jgi:4-hydroxythreonine-4-phosphate dehydrogenase|nr:4-hydroxythreonine-4-phosphate dehydrogenase PdxA [Gammaproteobacteria bacterium]MBT3695578.1 4-hydroxythreonine-4-phosphate dehydrogenase PdxA [Gammaproteobacteria bacterium]MBT5333866.1 4-hydroxythreonine-4-phosphate dehydrogenase PdxA [Gammaproteobacteria bacterium]MBT5682880.1 4-hydroxythreonine-4-phosphate dehydrogenase PdxA [Gammaproteobacteria bacterium]MBT6024108.1 4-hydroxythreonine-4-phosphate dehydrogenase PdxA [Gammaproteobacteria bacterium]